MQQTCTVSGQPFEITDIEIKRLEGISPIFDEKKSMLPAPTLSPQERVRRRMTWRNDRSFYHRKCSLTGKPIIALYPDGTPFPVYHTDDWWSDKWDPLSFGQEFDFSRPFFDQWNELMMKVPRRNMDLVNCENSQYCNYCGDDKNCYLDIAGESNEDCYYNLFTKYSTNCVDCTFAYHSTLCHECIHVHNSYACRNSMYLEDCSDCFFSYDLKGCKNCCLCINLRNKEFCILNEQHTREEYFKKIDELKLNTFSGLKAVEEVWKKMRIDKGVYRDMYLSNCENCTGNNIKNSKNCFWAFNATNCEDCTYLYDVLDAKDCQDLNYSLYKPELAYELISTLNMRYSAFNMASHYCSTVFYCDHTDNSHDLFGCIGLNHKEYCILNKQYNKEDYEVIVPKIIEHMKETGEWGEFFPASLSPHGYNETVAQEYMPLTKAEISSKGLKWADKEEMVSPQGAISDVPNSIDDATDAITKTPIICSGSGKAFKVIDQEFKFYREQKIPLPKKSPDERHKDRTEKRNPRQLWQRKCSGCGKDVWTSYSPDRPEKIYCDEEYLKLVYE